MKTKSFFFSMLFLAAILVGCEKPQTQTGEGEASSYVSVSVKSSMASRAATDGGYVEGEAEENEIQTIDFYFFATTGEPFKFNAPVTNGTTSGYSNLYTVSSSDITSSTGNIEEIVNVTLALQHNLGDYPGSIVAIVNGTKRFENLPIDQFRTHVFNSHKTSNGFLMSNSVYEDASGNEVFQTIVTPENFALTKDAAKANPVEIYVERTAVRVEVAQKTATESYDTGYDFNDGSTTKRVHAKIIGWDIVTTPKHSYTVKKIDLSWPEQLNGFTWNQPANYRSWWAESAFVNEPDSLVKSFKYSDLTNAVGLGKYDYCMENTALPEYVATGGVHDQVASRTNVTKAVIAAQLVEADGTTPVQVASWYGKDYTIEGLKIAIANSLKDKMFYGTGGGWASILPEHIQLVQGSGLVGEEESYEVYCQLTATASADYNWASDDGGTNIPSDQEQTYIRQNVEVAKIWNGMSYYIVNIQHLGVTEMDGTTYLPAYYGTVRNHAYQITFDAVKGLGTPVYDQNVVIPEPVQPDDTESFIEAKINVLSWHLIKQDVTLQ